MKHRLAKLVVFLLLGAVVNVAVAWACQLRFESLSWRVDAEFQFRGWEVWTTGAIGAQHMGTAVGGSPEDIASLEQWEPPGWSRLGQLPINENRDPVALRSDRAFGLPMLSVRYGLDAKRARGKLGVFSREVIGCLPYRDLAATPIWPGFAINTLFYAAVLMSLSLAPFALRRIVRHRRGFCINCGYDLRGDFSSGCPECGWRREDVS